MTSEQQDSVKLEGTPGYVDRPRLEILHIYDRKKPDQFWGTGIVEQFIMTQILILYRIFMMKIG